MEEIITNDKKVVKHTSDIEKKIYFYYIFGTGERSCMNLASTQINCQSKEPESELTLFLQEHHALAWETPSYKNKNKKTKKKTTQNKI